MAYRPLMSVDRLVGASGRRVSRAFYGAPERGFSGSSASAIARGEAVLAGEGSCGAHFQACFIFNPDRTGLGAGRDVVEFPLSTAAPGLPVYNHAGGAAASGARVNTGQAGRGPKIRP